MHNEDSLIEFVEQTTGERHFRVEQDFGNGFVRLESSEAERRQAQQDIRCIEDAVIEMLRNSRDAGANMIFVATGKSGDKRTVTLIDNGSGIPAELHKLVFEPRVTSKLDSFHSDRWGVHGRGMALYSISVNTENASVLASAPGLGTCIKVVSDASKLDERTDQSSMPVLVKDGDRTVFRGPRNINRTVAEFALDEREGGLTFLGSFIEIAATLYDLGCKAIPLKERIFHKPADEYPLVLRLALASDSEELSSMCADLGLDLSPRSARRIMDGEISPCKPFLQVLMDSQPKQSEKAPQNRANSSNGKFKLSDEAKDELARGVRDAFSSVAKSYYLATDVDVNIAVRNGELVIKLPIIPDDGQ